MFEWMINGGGVPIVISGPIKIQNLEVFYLSRDVGKMYVQDLEVFYLVRDEGLS